MKKFIVIIITKLMAFLGKILGRGSSLPGGIALRLCPDIISRLKLPENIIAVTGSNGKTSTAGMIYHVLSQMGYSVGYNSEGSNQIEGVATLLIRHSSLAGRVKKEYLVLEVDERFTRHVFRYITPKYLVVTNLYRDQLTRNGHPEYIYSVIGDSIDNSTRLVLNADDPLSSMLGFGRDGCSYFGIERFSLSKTENNSCYNDGVFCPNCKHRLNYEYYHFNHIGSYSCDNCGHKRHSPDYSVTDINLNEGYFVINSEYKISVSLRSLYNVYNLAAAFSVLSLLGVQPEDIAIILNNYLITNGRIEEFYLNSNKGMMLLSKHENSISYNQSIDYILNQDNQATVVILVDAISRKYFTSETSWLWDIDFEKLSSEKISKIILTGKYAYDLATRFEFTGIDSRRIVISDSIDNLKTILPSEAEGYIYVLTCFSDKDKFLKLV